MKKLFTIIAVNLLMAATVSSCTEAKSEKKRRTMEIVKENYVLERGDTTIMVEVETQGLRVIYFDSTVSVLNRSAPVYNKRIDNRIDTSL